MDRYEKIAERMLKELYGIEKPKPKPKPSPEPKMPESSVPIIIDLDHMGRLH